MVNSELIKDIALTWFCSTVADEAENGEGVLGENCNEIMRSQEDLMDTVPEFVVGYGLSVEPYLPIDLATEFVTALEKEWAGKLTLNELHEFDDKAIGRIALASMGHGVGPEDETETAEFLKEKGCQDTDYDSFVDVQSGTFNYVCKLNERLAELDKELHGSKKKRKK